MQNSWPFKPHIDLAFMAQFNETNADFILIFYAKKFNLQAVFEEKLI